MFGLQDITIDFLSGTLGIIVPIFIILLALSVWLYLRTNPPLPLYLRIIFTTLRITAVVALMAALSEPLISYTREFERPLKVAVLLDQSKSMDKIEGDKSRRARRDSLLSDGRLEDLISNTDSKNYYFAGVLSEDINNLEIDRTSLGDILKQLESQELGNQSDLWVLFSDGNSNFGSDPKKVTTGMNIPIHTIDISQSSSNFDIGITDIEFNPIMFSSQPGEIKLKIRWNDADNQKITIELKESQKVIKQNVFDINQSEGLADITLNYTPESPGQKIISVNIPVVSDEENKDNNFKSIDVKVLKSRLNIMLVCDAPDYEVGFLKRNFENSEKYNLELKVIGNQTGNLSGRFPSQQTEINRYDLIILYDLDFNKISNQKEIIKSYLSDKGGALWVLLGKRAGNSFNNDSWVNEILPFYSDKQETAVYSEFFGEVAENNIFHPAVRFGDSQSEIRKNWSELPPFKSLVRCNKTAEDATILVYKSQASSNQSDLPLIGFKRYGAGKVFESAALPFWIWKFNNQNNEFDLPIYDNFIEGTSSWLTVSDDLAPVRIVSRKSVYHRGEIVGFDGYAYDLGYRPIKDVNGVISLENSTTGESYETDFTTTEDGILAAEFYNLNPGQYNYRGIISKDNRILKETTGKLVIESYSLEEFDQSGNPENLRAIAKNTGGNYYTISDFQRLFESIDTKAIKVWETHEFKFFNKLWLLIIIIGAFVIEWFLRKLNQLI